MKLPARAVVVSFLLVLLVAAVPASALPFAMQLGGPSTVYLNEPVAYSGALKDAVAGAGIPLQSVKVYAGSSVAATATTDVSGNFTVVLAFTTAGPRQLRAVAFEGLPVVETSSAPFTVNVILNPSYDYDGDGITQAGGDCEPLDGGIYPGAPDPEEMTFADTNCDGIDGDEADAIFVSLSGNDANAGTKTSPKKTVGAAISTAALAGKDVYVSAGAYTPLGSSTDLTSNVGVYGGYDPTTWARSTANVTSLTGVGAVLVGVSDVGVTVQLMELRATAAPSGSAYGVHLTQSSAATLDNVRIVADPGVDAAAGATGPVGANGGPGGVGGAGATVGGFPCGASNPQPLGGFGGTTPGDPSGNGGFGGRPSSGSAGGLSGFPSAGGTAGGAGTPPFLGNWNPSPPYWGRDGAFGTDGAPGAGGTGAFGALGWSPSAAGTGSVGQSGRGGGGGGGGGGGTAFGCSRWGGGGGGGGGGGRGGAGGTGGGSGGGSIGVFVHASSVTLIDSSITTARGGKGGNGGAPGLGGIGGPGGRAVGDAGNPYGPSQADGSNGGRGGNGGNGGRGGIGGGGAGGPSIGILSGGGSSVTTSNVAIAVGPGGVGGSAAIPGSNGLSAATHTY